MDEGDMDSLFEGMVLFTNHPPPPPVETKTTAAAANDVVSQTIQPSQNLTPPPPVENEENNVGTTPQSSPLDENLFSDLTLVTPQSNDAEQASNVSNVSVASRSSPVLSRQSTATRKKKRAVGLRVGYGRERSQSQDDNDDSLDTARLPVKAMSSVSEPSSANELVRDGISKELDVAKQLEFVRKETPSAQINITAIASTSSSDSGESSSVELSSQTDIAKQSAALSHVSDSVSEENSSILTNVTATTTGSDDRDGDSFEMRYESMRMQIAEKLKHARDEVDALSAARKDAVKRRRKAAEDLIQASAKYKEIEKELEVACEAEDFETAERLSESLASAERNRELLAVALRDAEVECDDVDSKMQQVVELQIAAEEECVSLLRNFAKDSACSAEDILKTAELKTSKEIDTWLSSIEALEVKKMEVDIESHVVSEAQAVFNESIEHSVKDDKEKIEILHKKKGTLTLELEELLALVKQKEAELEENDSNIKEVEKRISEKVSGFQELQSNIHSKCNSLKSTLSQLELDNETLSKRKKELDDFLSHEEAHGSKIRELGKISSDEAITFEEAIGLRKSLVQFISKSREDKAKLALTAEKLADDVQILKKEISAARASLQDLYSTKSRIQQEVETFKQRLVFVDKRAPELESEKRVAATMRNFKEAGRIAAEVKTLYAEKESLQTKTEEAMSELEKLEGDIAHNVTRLQEIEEGIAIKEKELAMARYQRLLIIAGAATAERYAALELGDLNEADILLGEAQAAESEAKKLQPVYDFKEEFENIPKHFISIELVSKLDKNQLEELAASVNISAYCYMCTLS